MKIDVELEGEEEMIRKLKRLADKYPEIAARALYAEGLRVDADMVPRIPVDTGRLRSTHYVSPAKRRGGVLTVEVGVGTDYATRVHERTEVPHKVGEAKFLENALAAVVPGMSARIARFILSEIEGT